MIARKSCTTQQADNTLPEVSVRWMFEVFQAQSLRYPRLLREAGSSDFVTGFEFSRCLLRVTILQPSNLEWCSSLLRNICATKRPSVKLHSANIQVSPLLKFPSEHPMPFQTRSVYKRTLTDKISSVHTHLSTKDENLEKPRNQRLTVSVHTSSSTADLQHLRSLRKKPKKTGAMGTSFKALPRSFPTLTCSGLVWNSNNPQKEKAKRCVIRVTTNDTPKSFKPEVQEWPGCL